ncbi:DUF5590 domain-containing protein [Lactococcus insecticola]|uniref:Uncharacterized protein n=1 Tax=Pseudolactococcus insecticola TaxID=2709158 RepID=A0A6A0B8V9_9LACT|nr:DUF5590 domain-containing protein [Lactococcus insecticola]GFH40744.1 hypothetical protein Hs20B_11420 [Lactococcus insecticola]
MLNHRMTRTSQIWIGALLIVLAFLVGIFIFIGQLTAPYVEAKRDAIQLVKSKNILKTVENFNITTADSTTYSLVGVDAASQKVGVLMPQKGGEITTVKLSSNKSKLNEKTAKLTLYQGKPAWQKSDMTLYDFATGEKLR